METHEVGRAGAPATREKRNGGALERGVEGGVGVAHGTIRVGERGIVALYLVISLMNNFGRKVA